MLLCLKSAVRAGLCSRGPGEEHPPCLSGVPEPEDSGEKHQDLVWRLLDALSRKQIQKPNCQRHEWKFWDTLFQVNLKLFLGWVCIQAWEYEFCYTALISLEEPRSPSFWKDFEERLEVGKDFPEEEEHWQSEHEADKHFVLVELRLL